MSDTSSLTSTYDSRRPGPASNPVAANTSSPHQGVQVLGQQGEEGRKAFYIHIEALPGKEMDVVRMLEDILHCVEGEPATGPWYGVRYSQTTFGIFEVFPDLAGRQAHVEGGGGDIFRDVKRMNAILAYPAQVYRMDVLLGKEVFAH